MRTATMAACAMVSLITAACTGPVPPTYCDPTAEPPQFCPAGGQPCPKCGQVRCPCPAPSYNPNLRFFSVYSGGTASPEALRGWVNFLATDANVTSLARFHREGGPGFTSLYPVQSTFFCGRLLCPDWRARWQRLYRSTIKPGIAGKWLMGVHFGDELVWSCTPWGNLSAAADLVREDLPRGTAILTYNEAYPVFVTAPTEPGSLFPAKDAGLWQWNCDTGGGQHNRTPAPGMRINGSYVYPRVPDALDWLSLDYYPSEGTIEGTIRLFKEQIYPKLSKSQSVM